MLLIGSEPRAQYTGTQSVQLPCIRATVFSQVAVFLDNMKSSGHLREYS